MKSPACFPLRREKVLHLHVTLCGSASFTHSFCNSGMNPGTRWHVLDGVHEANLWQDSRGWRTPEAQMRKGRGPRDTSLPGSESCPSCDVWVTPTCPLSKFDPCFCPSSELSASVSESVWLKLKRQVLIWALFSRDNRIWLKFPWLSDSQPRLGISSSPKTWRASQRRGEGFKEPCLALIHNSEGFKS